MNYACRIEICSMKLKIRIERENANRAKPAGGRGRRKMDEREATGDEIHLVLTRRRGRRQPYYIEGSMLYRMGPAPQCFSCFPCSVHSQRYSGPSQISIFFPMRSQQRAPASRRHMERKHVRSYGQRVRNHFIVWTWEDRLLGSRLSHEWPNTIGGRMSVSSSPWSPIRPDIADMVDSREWNLFWCHIILFCMMR